MNIFLSFKYSFCSFVRPSGRVLYRQDDLPPDLQPAAHLLCPSPLPLPAPPPSLDLSITK